MGTTVGGVFLDGETFSEETGSASVRFDILLCVLV